MTEPRRKHFVVTVQIEEISDAVREWNASARQMVETSPRTVRDRVRIVSASGEGTEADLDTAISKAIALLQVEKG